MQPSHAAIYARVSSDQQTADKAIASQLAALEARLAQEGLRVVPEHRFLDEGYSGATLVRPALERLRDAAAAGALDRPPGNTVMWRGWSRLMDIKLGAAIAGATCG